MTSGTNGLRQFEADTHRFSFVVFFGMAHDGVTEVVMREFSVNSRLVIAFAFLAAGCEARPPSDLPLDEEASAEATEEVMPVTKLGDTRTRSIDGSIMVYVPAGDFMMGSEDKEVDFALKLCREHDTNCSRSYFSVEQAAHSVVLDAFWIDLTEVTMDRYRQCEQAGVCEGYRCGSEDSQGEGNHPVV